MNILLVGKGISNESLKKVLEKDNTITFAIDENENLDDESIYKKDVNINNVQIIKKRTAIFVVPLFSYERGESFSIALSVMSLQYSLR